MANSRFQYVRKFEQDDSLLPDTWLVVRLDGRGFHKFSEAHSFAKPNDPRAIKLMNKAALGVMLEFTDVMMAYGQSDEYSFLLRKGSTLYNRRASKICSTFVSIFTSWYVYYWGSFFPETALMYPPSFDGRVVCYPNEKCVRDYFSWRQADCHINNLYNTCFWALVTMGHLSPKEAEAQLRTTVSKEKHELLFSRFAMNYNFMPEVDRKGSIPIRLIEEELEEEDKEETEQENKESTLIDGVATKGVEDEINMHTISEKEQSPSANRPAKKLKKKKKPKTTLEVLHVDLIGDEFWKKHSHVLL